MTGWVSNHGKLVHLVIQNRRHRFTLLWLRKVPPAAKEEVEEFRQNRRPVIGEHRAEGFPEEDDANLGSHELHTLHTLHLSNARAQNAKLAARNFHRKPTSVVRKMNTFSHPELPRASRRQTEPQNLWPLQASQLFRTPLEQSPTAKLVHQTVA